MLIYTACPHNVELHSLLINFFFRQKYVDKPLQLPVTGVRAHTTHDTILLNNYIWHIPHRS